MFQTITLAGSLSVSSPDMRASVHAITPYTYTVYGEYDASQDWFWAERWQRMEAEADQDIAQDNILHYDDADAMFADFDGFNEGGS